MSTRSNGGTKWHLVPVLVLVGIALMWGLACGVAQEEYDALQVKLTAEEQTAATLQQRLTTEEQSTAAFQQKLTTEEQSAAALQQRLTTEEQSAAALQQRLTTEEQSAAALQQRLTTEEQEAATLQQQLVALEPGLSTLNLAVDMVLGHTNPQGPMCALTSRYQRGEMIVWRARITDPATGQQLPTALEELLAAAPSGEEVQAMATDYKVEIRLSDGQSFPMRFGIHGGADYFWTVSWVIPEDYPTGSLDYTMVAEDPEGRGGTFKPYQVGLSLLTILERTELPLVVAADMVRGHTNPQGPLCALTSRYQRGEMVVWRARVTNSETGKAIPADTSELLAQDPSPTGEELAAMTEGIQAVVHLSDGQSFPMRFGIHGGADYFWTVSWDIPEDYPTGTIEYWITVDWAEESKTGRWDPPNVGISKLTILEAATAQ